MIWLALACDDHLTPGVAAYDAGRLDEAIAAWEAAPRPRSGVLAYNLGVAYHRAGDLPRAIAAFRAAGRLRPRDGNVQHNLAVARSGLEGVPVPIESPDWQSVVTPGELGLGSVAVAALGSLVVVIRRARLLGVALLLGGLAAGIFAAAAATDQQEHPYAVVVEPELVLRDAASINARERLRLPAGAEVRITRRAGDFALVEDGRARRGWVPANGLELAW